MGDGNKYQPAVGDVVTLFEGGHGPINETDPGFCYGTISSVYWVVTRKAYSGCAEEKGEALDIKWTVHPRSRIPHATEKALQSGKCIVSWEDDGVRLLSPA